MRKAAGVKSRRPAAHRGFIPCTLQRENREGGGETGYNPGEMKAERDSIEIPIRVRYAETDAMGYLHHSQYLVYFEMGRTELLRKAGISYRSMEESGFYYVVARMEVRYRVPARYDDELLLRTTSERFTRVRVDHSYHLTRGGVLLAEGNSTLACVGRDGRPTGLPEELFERICARSGETT